MKYHWAGEPKCRLIAQMYEQMGSKLERLDHDWDAAGPEPDIAAFNLALDELELICNELKKILSLELQKVLSFLKPRFDTHMYRHPDITWEQVERRLCEAHSKKLWSLNEMERTGGEPDVVRIEKTGELIFEDRAAETPFRRIGCVYDREAEAEFRRAYPLEQINGNAVDMAAQMGVEIMDAEQYINSQKEEAQNQPKRQHLTWSWVKTPADIREENGALRGTRRGNLRVEEVKPIEYAEGLGWHGWLKV